MTPTANRLLVAYVAVGLTFANAATAQRVTSRPDTTGQRPDAKPTQEDAPWWLQEFHERRQRGISRVQGSFLYRGDKDEWTTTLTTDLLRRMRGVSVAPVRGRSARTQFVIRRPGNTDGMQIYLNGSLIGNSEDLDLDTAVNIVHIQAIEVYGNGWVPDRYRRRGHGRGVVLIWTG